jgi:hypothetical protein
MPNMVKHHIIHAVVAAVMAGAGAGYAIHRAAETPPIVVHASHAKLHVADWPGLSDEESSRLVTLLKTLPVETISIFCADSACQDLAEDFSDVFEAAGWPEGIEQPKIDTNVGINIGPDVPAAHSLAQAIETATDGRMAVGFLKGKLEDNRLGLVISRKPR